MRFFRHFHRMWPRFFQTRELRFMRDLCLPAGARKGEGSIKVVGGARGGPVGTFGVPSHAGRRTRSNPRLLACFQVLAEEGLVEGQRSIRTKPPAHPAPCWPTGLRAINLRGGPNGYLGRGPIGARPMETQIYEFKKVDLRDAIVIDGFPSVGLVSSIVANYLIALLRLELIGIVDSPQFPTVSLIRGQEPMSPARLYASPRTSKNTAQLAAFVSEFQPPPGLVRDIAHSMLDWAEERRCRLIISPGGLVIEREGEKGRGIAPAPPPLEEVNVYGVASTSRASALLTETDIEIFTEGVVSGIAGVLLNDGVRRDFDVITLLAQAQPEIADARAAALLVAAIDRMVLHMNLDLEPLCREAEGIEARLKVVRHEAVRKTRPAPEEPAYG